MSPTSRDELESRLDSLTIESPSPRATLMPVSELHSIAMAARAAVEADTVIAPDAVDGGGHGSHALASLPSLAVLGLERGARIGRGGMASVYVANQQALGREVAVKIAHRDVGTAGMGELLHEAWACGVLEHPNLVPVHLLASDERGRPALVMRRISGRAWSALLAADGADLASRDLATHVRTLVQICNALHYAHSRGILHRDIKPDNVMIGDFGEVWLVDWGVAVALDARHAGRLVRADEAEGIAGTPAYMAPEMVERSLGRLDVTTDVFLVGATLHELLTGAPPWASETVLGALHKALRAEPIVYDAAVPDELAHVARRAMSADPALRFPDVAALREALESYLEHRSAHALVAQARLRLEELDAELASPSPDPVETQRLYTEARFGCEQALRMWPDGESGRTLRNAIVARMAAHEIAQRHLGSAERLVAELDEVPGSLAASLEALRARLRVEQEELESLRRDQDLTVGARARGLVVVAVGLLALVLGVALMAIAGRAGTDAPAPIALVVPQLTFVAAVAAIFIWQRRRLMRTRVDRQFVAAFFVLLVGMVAMRIVGLVRGAAFVELGSQQLGLLTVGTAMMAVTIDRFMAWASVSLAVGTLLLQLWPAEALPIVGLSQVLGCVIVGAGWARRVRRDDAAAGGDP